MASGRQADSACSNEHNGLMKMAASAVYDATLSPNWFRLSNVSRKLLSKPSVRPTAARFREKRRGVTLMRVASQCM